MSRAIFSAPHFNDEASAYAYVEARIWPDGRVCPKCGVFDKSGPLKGKSNRIGLYKCYACRKPFTVKVGTIFEDSHIQMRDWLVAIHMICSSKKGVSSNQLHRTLGITLKSAWFMSHRIREAMTDTDTTPVGGAGGVVEVDETYLGPTTYRTRTMPDGTTKVVGNTGNVDKRKVVTLVERGGKARSHHVARVTAENISEILNRYVHPDTRLMTDEGKFYREPGKEFFMHERVNHKKKEYVRGDVYTNTVEGFFSIFKRGLSGVYQHCSEQHLHRYLTEFDFRYSNRVRLGVDDTQRAEKALKGVSGKRLTYRRINEPKAPSLGE
jgi:transposase-like protein